MDIKMKKEDKFILNKLLFSKLDCSLYYITLTVALNIMTCSFGDSVMILYGSLLQTLS